MKPAPSRTAAAKRAERQRLTQRLSARERMALALYLGHRSRLLRERAGAAAP